MRYSVVNGLINLVGLSRLQSLTQGDPEIRIAILDGLIDTKHPCFAGAKLQRLSTLVQGEASAQGKLSGHGTHVASLIFGQQKSPISGIAPRCQGIIIPIFSDETGQLSQLDLARAINQAVSAGAHIINISGGQLVSGGAADYLLTQAVKSCQDNNILLVAAAGNDGCECLHVPAALPAVLAVGAMDDRGHPLNLSNWGKPYQTQGILAPGANVLGAAPGGGVQRLSGTSFATPIVTGVAALLLSLQRQRGDPLNPAAVRSILLKSALPCRHLDPDSAPQCLAGRLNVVGAMKLMKGESMSVVPSSEWPSSDVPKAGIHPSADGRPVGEHAPTEPGTQPAQPLETNAVDPQAGVVAAGCGCQNPTAPTESAQVSSVQASDSFTDRLDAPMVQASAVTASRMGSQTGSSIVYTIGTLGYDFASEARRDSFKQLMPGVDFDGLMVPANPYDARQIADYLGDNLSEAKSLIWTLNMELTPLYAIQAVGPFARDVYEVLQQMLAGQVEAEDSEDYIERVSLPGRLTGQTVTLFSGQRLPVIVIDSPRGLYGWKVNTLVEAAVSAVQTAEESEDDAPIRQSLESFLNRVYYDLRNLGRTSQERALNFAATNAFQAASTFSAAVVAGMELDDIQITKSPFCRMDSDCWDVVLRFFDAENIMRARKVFRFTIDVSDVIPVTLGDVRSWSAR